MCVCVCPIVFQSLWLFLASVTVWTFLLVRLSWSVSTEMYWPPHCLCGLLCCNVRLRFVFPGKPQCVRATEIDLCLHHLKPSSVFGVCFQRCSVVNSFERKKKVFFFLLRAWRTDYRCTLYVKSTIKNLNLKNVSQLEIYSSLGIYFKIVFQAFDVITTD